jgi:hypothetical protein
MSDHVNQCTFEFICTHNIIECFDVVVNERMPASNICTHDEAGYVRTCIYAGAQRREKTRGLGSNTPLMADYCTDNCESVVKCICDRVHKCRSARMHEMRASFRSKGWLRVLGSTAFAVVYLVPADNPCASKTGYNAPLSRHSEGALP